MRYLGRDAKFPLTYGRMRCNIYNRFVEVLVSITVTMFPLKMCCLSIQVYTRALSEFKHVFFRPLL